MKTLVISAVALFLSLGGAAVAQTTTVVVPGEVRTYVQKQETRHPSPLKVTSQSVRHFLTPSRSTRSPINLITVM